MIALIAVGLTQNKPLPENVKVTQLWGGLAGVQWGKGEGGCGKSEHTGGVEILAAQEQVNIHWIKEVKWSDAHGEEGMSWVNWW